MMMHNHTKFGYKVLPGLEDLFWTKPKHGQTDSDSSIMSITPLPPPPPHTQLCYESSETFMSSTSH